MRHFIGSLAALAFAVVAVPAAAEGSGEKHGRPSFPMPAAAFKERVESKVAKARARMEERAKQLPADQAKEVRGKFDASVAAMNAELAKATADGTVTRDEAHAVRAAGPHRGKHGCDGTKKS